jgi:hypothetical protein
MPSELPLPSLPKRKSGDVSRDVQPCLPFSSIHFFAILALAGFIADQEVAWFCKRGRRSVRIVMCSKGIVSIKCIATVK